MIQQTVERLKPLAGLETHGSLPNEYLAQEIARPVAGIAGRQHCAGAGCAQYSAGVRGGAFLIERENPDACWGVSVGLM